MTQATRDRPAAPDAAVASDVRPVMLLTLNVPFEEAAVEFAVDSAAETGAELYICDAIPLGYQSYVGHAARQYAEAFNRRYLDAAARRSRERGVRTTQLAFHNRKPVGTALEIAREQRVGLLVFGAESASEPRPLDVQARRPAPERRGDLPGLDERLAPGGAERDPQHDLEALLAAQATSKTWGPAGPGDHAGREHPAVADRRAEADRPDPRDRDHRAARGRQEHADGRLIESFSRGDGASPWSRSTRRARSAAAPCSATGVRMESAPAGARRRLRAQPRESRLARARSPAATRNVARLLEVSGSLRRDRDRDGRRRPDRGRDRRAGRHRRARHGARARRRRAGDQGRLMEVADMVVVNMADRPGAPETDAPPAAHARPRRARSRRRSRPTGEGVDELRDRARRALARPARPTGGSDRAASAQARARGGADRPRPGSARAPARRRDETRTLEQRGQGDSGGGSETMDHVAGRAGADASAGRVEQWREERLRARLRARAAAAARSSRRSSGLPVDDVYTPADLADFDLRAATSAARASTPTRAARTRACTAAGRGRSARSPASARPRTRTAATSTCSRTARPGCRPTSTCRRCSATTPTTRSTGARSARSASPIDTVVDAHALFDGIPLDEVSTSLTINALGRRACSRCTASSATSAASPASKLTGTTQNDILKEYTAQNEFIFPPEPSVELVVDTMEYGAAGDAALQPAQRLRVPHPRRRGDRRRGGRRSRSPAALCYLERAKERGIDVDSLAPRVSFFWDVHNDFLEEIAKLRAARRLWARLTRERLGCRDPRSWLMRAHCQTSGVSLTAQQPLNNVARTAIQALAAVLGGTQSLHTNSLDEAFAIPSEEAIKIAVRTQQILLEETRRRRRRRPARRLLLRGALHLADRGGGRRPDRPDRRDGRDDRGDPERLREPDHRRLGLGAAAAHREQATGSSSA